MIIRTKNKLETALKLRCNEDDRGLSKSDIFFSLWYKMIQAGMDVERVGEDSYVVTVHHQGNPVTCILVDRRIDSTYDMMRARVTVTFWDYGQILLDDGDMNSAVAEDVTNAVEAIEWVEDSFPHDVTVLEYNLTSEKDASELARNIQGIVLQMESDLSDIEEYLQSVYTKHAVACRRKLK